MFRHVRRLYLAGLFIGAFSAPATALARDGGSKPVPLTEAEVSALKQEAARRRERGTGAFAEYREPSLEKPEPIPWMAIGMGAIAFLVAAPFAFRAYRDTARELNEATAFASPNRRGSTKNLRAGSETDE